jgi:hypothetical protein
VAARTTIFLQSFMKIRELVQSLMGVGKHIDIQGPFAKFVDSPYYPESELCGGAVTVSFSKYLSWEAMHFLQRFTHFSKTELRSF